MVPLGFSRISLLYLIFNIVENLFFKELSLSFLICFSIGWDRLSPGNLSEKYIYFAVPNCFDGW